MMSHVDNLKEEDFDIQDKIKAVHRKINSIKTETDNCQAQMQVNIDGISNY